MSYENILVETKGKVGIIRLNRPQALNALSSALLKELFEAVAAFERDPGISCIVLTGSEKAFAAGADIKEMADQTYMDVFMADFCADRDLTQMARKPVIAAVAGFALGGGCEIAMMCDFIIAADNAKFGQPEIKLGIIPGAGGTQRLARVVGKSRAMQMVLSGEPIDGTTALNCGLASEVLPAAEALPRAMALARTIAAKAPLGLRTAKEAVLLAEEAPLSAALNAERTAFVVLAASQDRQEGISAFLEKRPARFQGR